MRYAIYYCPAADSALGEFGRAWLAAAPPVFNQRGEISAALLADVRRYGWHATIRAPFALRAGVACADLRRAVMTVAQDFAAFALPLRLDRLAGFLALRPAGDSRAIDSLADACLHALEPLRAPMAADAAQRRADGLEPVERALLERYGYPYVLDRYRFHMTLSAPASEPQEQTMRAWLARDAARWSMARVDALSICRETAPGADFEQVERISLQPERAP